MKQEVVIPWLLTQQSRVSNQQERCGDGSFSVGVSPCNQPHLQNLAPPSGPWAHILRTRALFEGLGSSSSLIPGIPVLV